MRTRAPWLTLFLLLAFLVAPPSPTAMPAAATHGDVLEVGFMDAPTRVDGIVAAGEYSHNHTDPDTGITIHVQYSGNVLGITLESPGQGWVALSLGAVLVGSNVTDVLVFSEDNGTVRALDEVDHGWERHLDVTIGGTDDIIAAAAATTGTGWRVEFQVPLDSADDNDHHFLANGTYPFSLAYNATSMDPLTPDTAHSMTDLLLHVGPTPEIYRAERTTVRASEQELVAGQKSTISGVLVNTSGRPLQDQPVEFYLKTTFGLLYLGLGRTNSLGKAGIIYEPKNAGTWTLYIAFRGTGQYLPSNDTVLLTVLEAPAAAGFWLTTTLGITTVVFLVVGGVWGSYLFVASQLLAIRRIGRRNVTGLPSQRGEGGENHR